MRSLAMWEGEVAIYLSEPAPLGMGKPDNLI
jgi:hypothetical protein